MRSTLLFGLAGMTLGCGGNPCDEYADLKCECAETDEECDSLRLTYENADVEQQDECSAELDDAQAEAESCQEEDQEG